MADNSASLSAMAKALQEGESIARCKRLPITEIMEGEAVSELTKMRNSMNQVAVRARASTGNNFRLDSGQFVNSDGTALILAVSLTRMEETEEDFI